MQNYRLSAAGRRTTLILLVGAIAIWAFALWSFRSTLNISYNPLKFFPSLQAAIAQGLDVSEVIPAVLMLVLIIATPLLVWNLLEEWSAVYTPTDEGLRFESMGVRLSYPWKDMQAIRRIDADSDEPMDEIALSADHTGQISNPVLRFLHAQAYGRRKLPIYAGLESRDALVTEIVQRSGLTLPGDAPEEQVQAPNDIQPI